MDVVTKSVEATVSPVESEHPNGEFEVVLSTETKDRDGENLWPEEWITPLPMKIHMDGDHGRSLEKTVGSAVPRIEDGKLIGKGTYAGTEYAQMVRQLVNEGHVNSVSVTYAEHKNQKDNTIQRELLNAAFVAIPANPEAIVLSSKSAKVEDKAEGGLSASGDNPQVKHDDMIQAIHDAAAHLGAQCSNAAEADPGTADGANKGVSIEISNANTEDFQNQTYTARVGDKTKRFTHEQLDDGTALKWLIETSSDKAGSPKESADESAAAETAEKSAVSAAADESADNEAARKVSVAAKARALQFLIKKAGEHA